MPLARLPENCVSRLRSNTIVGSLAQAAEELVCNCLDAGASQIHVTLDVLGCALCVEDDGRGVCTSDLGALATRHATSKLTSLAQLEAGVDTLGFRGEALASLAGAGDADKGRAHARPPLTQRPAQTYACWRCSRAPRATSTRASRS